MKRFGLRPDPARHYTRRPGAYGIILSGHQALLALNSCPGEEWALPGGGIDPGETPIRALHREAMEETGYRIIPERRIGAYKRFTYMPEYDLWAEKICHIYLCRAGRCVADPIEPDHVPIWVSAHDAPDILSNEGDRAVFKAVQRVITL